MLDTLRQSAQSKFAKIILVLITVPFALWGVDSYIRTAGSSDDVATVGDRRISSMEFSETLREQQDRMRAMLGRAYDPAMFDNPETRLAVLDQLINQHLLLSEALRSGMIVSDAALAARIAEIPTFQQDGKFSKARYDAFLRQQGMTERGFEARLRQDLLVQALRDGVTETTMVSRTLTDNLIRAAEQSREVSFIRYTPEQHEPEVKVDEAAIKAYYDKNQQEFAVPEQVRLEYVVFSADQLLPQMSVTDEEVKKYYQEHASQYKQAEERRASHILISVTPDAPEAERKAAREKVEDLLGQLKQKPEAFAELAEKFSQDPGSAGQGGDLGFFGRGTMVKPFEDAVFQMAKGEIRGPVQSDYGLHIIKLTDIKPEKTRSLEEASPEIMLELKKQKAGKRFADAAEAFANAVYEQPESLKPVAETYKLPLLQSPWITRAAAPVVQLNNPKLLEAVFSEDVLKNRRNTEAIEVAPNVLVSARVLEHKPAGMKPLEEVKQEIAKRLTREEAGKLAVKLGQAQLEELRQGKADLTWPAPVTVTRQQPGGLPPAIVAEVFKAEGKSLPAHVGAQDPQGGYFLVKITKITDGVPDDAKRERYAEQLKEVVAQQEFAAVLDSLRRATEVKIRKEAVEKKER